MKIALLLLVIAYVECFPKKPLVPLDKHANVDFINMEGGGGARPGPKAAPVQPQTLKPVVTTKPVAAPAQPTQKPVHVAPTPKPVVAPTPVPVKPSQPQQIQPKPVNSPPSSHPVSTPGPGSVKQLVTFYDSQGKASQIRPYSYSQAVKQG